MYKLIAFFMLAVPSLPVHATVPSPPRIFPEGGIVIKVPAPLPALAVPSDLTPVSPAVPAPAVTYAAPAAPPASAYPPQPSGTTYAGCGDNSYANFIYMHESGCNTYNPNASSGACGLGQAWPCSKLMNACPNMDYACENSWFTSYAAGFGGWEAAYNYWVSHGYW